MCQTSDHSQQITFTTLQAASRGSPEVSGATSSPPWTFQFPHLSIHPSIHLPVCPSDHLVQLLQEVYSLLDLLDLQVSWTDASSSTCYQQKDLVGHS